MTNKEFKNCPYCDQTIERSALTCKNCKSPLVNETTPERYNSSNENTDDDRVTLEIKCPDCNAYIPKDAPFCENCRAQGYWKEGRAKFNRSFAIHHSGCTINSCGCLLPLLLLLLMILLATGSC